MTGGEGTNKLIAYQMLRRGKGVLGLIGVVCLRRDAAWLTMKLKKCLKGASEKYIVN